MTTSRHVPAAIAARVKRERSVRGWTLDEMASRCGVSRRMLVNVEQAVANPSIATLLRIADAFGIGLPALVDVDPGQTSWTLTRSGTAPVLWRGEHGGQAELVAGTEPPDVVELWSWTMHPRERHSSQAHSSGTRELLLVSAGQVTVAVDGATELLSTGDAISFQGDRPHSYAHAAPLDGPATFLLTVFAPDVGRPARVKAIGTSHPQAQPA